MITDDVRGAAAHRRAISHVAANDSAHSKGENAAFTPTLVVAEDARAVLGRQYRRTRSFVLTLGARAYSRPTSPTRS